ncbi:MAG: FtsX-like permease family protein [bacterium]|nr:FtsX-like permease family protein [bacterium]
MARIAPGVSLSQARAEIAALGERVVEAHPDAFGDEKVAFRVEPLHDDVVQDIAPAIRVLFAAAGLVLLIACANVASLQLARGEGRRRELSIRGALGASHGRILRQLVTENVLLGFLAAPGGLSVALAGIVLLRRLPIEIPRAERIALDGTVLTFALVLSVVAASVNGNIPSLRASRREPGEMLRTRSGGGRSRVRAALVVSEVAISLVLLAGAGLMLRSLIAIQQVPLGFEPRSVLTFGISVDPESLRTVGERYAYYELLLDEIGSIPGVLSAGGIRRLPMVGDEFTSAWSVGALADHVRQGRSASYDWVLPGYFETVGIRTISGRDFVARDQESETLEVVVNASLAELAWPGEDAIGRQLNVDRRFGREEIAVAEVIGVVDDTRSRSPREAAHAQIYLPFSNLSSPSANLFIVARVDGDPLAVAGAVSADAVRRRTHEIGVRMAIGADRGQILRQVVGKGLVLALAGVAAGLVIAAVLGRSLRFVLYEVRPSDPATLAGAAGLLLVVTVVACFVPGRRATRVDPASVLRTD